MGDPPLEAGATKLTVILPDPGPAVAVPMVGAPGTLAGVTALEAPDAGPALFRQGLSFAVGLTLLPIPLVIFSWLARAVAHLF